MNLSTGGERLRVVSMVPSWTETLIRAGVNVVGRTRYCIHPADMVESIPIVGGTKDLNISVLNSIKHDLLILDREENPKRFVTRISTPWWASAVDDYQSLSVALNELSEIVAKFDAQATYNANPSIAHFSSPAAKLKSWADMALAIHLQEPQQTGFLSLPGVIEWLNPPTGNETNLVYMIWRNPWIAVSRGTFIGAGLAKFGYGSLINVSAEKYPKINLDDLDPKTTIILFSSEPYLFRQESEELRRLPFKSALIEGESFSWFGYKSISFMAKHIMKEN
jgi:hypothetical protein